MTGYIFFQTVADSKNEADCLPHQALLARQYVSVGETHPDDGHHLPLTLCAAGSKWGAWVVLHGLTNGDESTDKELNPHFHYWQCVDIHSLHIKENLFFTTKSVKRETYRSIWLNAILTKKSLEGKEATAHTPC